jgi:hypothetical protein
VTGQLAIAEPKIGMAVRGEVEIVRRSEFTARHGMVFHRA